MQDKKEEQASWMWSLLTTDLMSRTELFIDCPGSPLARVFPFIRSLPPFHHQKELVILTVLDRRHSSYSKKQRQVVLNYASFKCHVRQVSEKERRKSQRRVNGILYPHFQSQPWCYLLIIGFCTVK